MTTNRMRSSLDRQGRMEERKKVRGFRTYLAIVVLVVLVCLTIGSIFYRYDQQRKMEESGGVDFGQLQKKGKLLALSFEIDEGDSQRVLELEVDKSLKKNGAKEVKVKLVDKPFDVYTCYFFVPSNRYDVVELQNNAIEYGTDISTPLPKRLDVRFIIGKDIEEHIKFAKKHKISLSRDTTVEVLNGSGIEGKASEVKSILEEGGFKVLAIRNAESSGYASSEILVGAGNLEVAEPLRQLFNFSSETVAETLPDCIVVLGEDYNK
jgi:hypothetical protein